MTIRVTFICGHTQDWRESETPICRTCGDTRIGRTTAPPPRITGTCEAPYKVKEM